MKNAYHTDDPQKLLELKRLEASALLDVVRAFNNSEHTPQTLCRIACNTLLAQLRVRKMIFLYAEKEDWVEGIRMGFPEFAPEALDELLVQSVQRKVDPSAFPALFSMGIEYFVPIVIEKQARAFFMVADFADSEIETRNDLIFIETLGYMLAFAIRMRQLFQAQMEDAFMRREVEVAGVIQKQLLISDFSRFREMDVFGVNIPQQRVGGDFYDVIKKEKGITLVCIADVSGKGMGAALLMANLQANLRALSAQYDDLETIVSELNRILYNISTGEKFVTLFLAKIDSENRLLTYLNAGHNYPVLVGPGRLIPLESVTIFLGVMPELSGKSRQLSFEPGELLFMYTDGVVEQFNATGEMYGSERLHDLLASNLALGARGHTEAVLHSLEDFAGNSPSHDDITILSVKFL